MIERRIPLLKDNHTHPSQYASFSDAVNLQEIDDKDQALIKFDGLKSDELNIALGWNSGYYRFRDGELDEYPPLIICNLSFHQFVVNDPAARLMSNKYPEMIENIEDESWVEQNLPTILRNLTEIKFKDKEQLNGFFRSLVEKGVWYAEEMLLPNEIILEAYKKTDLTNRTAFWTDFQTYDGFSDVTKKKIEGIKIFVDGALGSSTAAIKGQYKDGHDGLLLYSDSELEEKISTVFKERKRPAIHAIGDRATEQTVKVLKRIEKKGFDLTKARMEHCQFITKSCAEEAKDLGITLCMQPNFNTDSIHYRDRLHRDYQEKNNPFRMLIDEVGFVPGVDLIFGSDGMPHGVEPALRASLFPPFGYQTLELEEFIDGYCMDTLQNGYIDVLIDIQEKRVRCEINPKY